MLLYRVHGSETLRDHDYTIIYQAPADNRIDKFRIVQFGTTDLRSSPTTSFRFNLYFDKADKATTLNRRGAINVHFFFS